MRLLLILIFSSLLSDSSKLDENKELEVSVFLNEKKVDPAVVQINLGTRKTNTPLTWKNSKIFLPEFPDSAFLDLTWKNYFLRSEYYTWKEVSKVKGFKIYFYDLKHARKNPAFSGIAKSKSISQCYSLEEITVENNTGRIHKGCNGDL